MSSERASVFDQGPDIDISGFKPRTAAKPAAQPDQVKAISETASFVSREPIRAPRQTAVAPIAREPRRHRTGNRNIQLNIKARAETIERFYAIADRHGWVLGETFERAIARLIALAHELNASFLACLDARLRELGAEGTDTHSAQN
jgi:hypothetical protein